MQMQVNRDALFVFFFFISTASSQVILTVQQRTQKVMGSPSLHYRPLATPSNTRITGPQPVDVSAFHI